MEQNFKVARTFKLMETEMETFKEWYDKHECPEKRRKSKINQQVASPVSTASFIFTPASIGSLVSARCVCGEEIDITDVGTW